jgi:cellulose biosynthesis protein BcsQ
VIKNALMVLNGKGGVLKTTLAAQIAGLAAHSGWRVLAVDLDQQGNLARDLGYMHRSDGGSGLLTAVTTGRPVAPLTDVRSNLDVIAGGPELNKLYRHLALESGSSPLRKFDLLEGALRAIAGPYSLIVLDSPPGGEIIHLEAMAAARAVVVPTQPDQGSIDGLATVFRTWRDIKAGPNPDLAVLGIALGPIPTQATRLRSDTIAHLHHVVGERVHVFDAVIRSAQSIAVTCREQGLLVNEYENAAAVAPRWYQLSKDERARRRGYSTAASGLADDYQSLVGEILGRFAELRGAS